MAAIPATPRRRVRERELVQATRALFDQRGVQDAPVEEIARTVGIARGLIYRHFSSKEELYVLTVTDYLSELDGVLAAAASPDDEVVRRLETCLEAYARFCERYPAFLDCALSLMQRPARELHGVVSEAIWLRLGQGMASCIGHLTRVLATGSEQGRFALEDPDYAANVLWTQTLGTMHLARIRVGVRQLTPEIPQLFPVTGDQVIETCVRNAVASVLAPPRP